MKTLLITSKIEIKRAANIANLKLAFENITIIDAVYPSVTKVPFLAKLKAAAIPRIKRPLSDGELGCILSHRKAWTKILHESSSEASFLILESDAIINEASIIKMKIEALHETFDIVFWGAFDGRAKLFNSKRSVLIGKYKFGTPLLNALYCTYGYSINKKAARYLLSNTKKPLYPVDYWKYRLANSGLEIGAVVPELIRTEGRANSYVQDPTNFSIFEFLFDKLIDAKNTLLCYFR